MGHTHSRLLYHYIFATHRRTKWLKPEMQAEVYAYLATLLAKDGAHVYKINGMEDHVHVVLQLRTKPAVADIMEHAKAYASGWIKRRFGIKDFAWQEGYGVFTISPSQLNGAIRYVENQKEKHKKISFEEEYKWFLEKHGIEFDPEKLFDDGPEKTGDGVGPPDAT